MPVVNENDIIDVSIRGIFHGQRTINTFRMGVFAAPGTPLELLPFLAGFFSIFESTTYAAWVQLVSAGVGNTVIRAQISHPVRGQFRDYLPAGGTGSLGGTVLPTINATRIRRRNFRGNRHGQGRIFLPGLPAADTSQSVLLPAAVTAKQAIVDAGMFSILLFLGYELRHILVPPHTAFDRALDQVNSPSVEREVSPQAKRRVGRGE